jgi:histidinol dehydrogenase
MNVIRYTDFDFAEQLRRMTGASDLFDQAIEDRTREILRAVYTRGDAALVEMTERFDHARLNVTN